MRSIVTWMTGSTFRGRSVRPTSVRSLSGADGVSRAVSCGGVRCGGGRSGAFGPASASRPSPVGVAVGAGGNSGSSAMVRSGSGAGGAGGGTGDRAACGASAERDGGLCGRILPASRPAGSADCGAACRSAALGTEWGGPASGVRSWVGGRCPDSRPGRISGPPSGSSTWTDSNPASPARRCAYLGRSDSRASPAAGWPSAIPASRVRNALTRRPPAGDRRHGGPATG